MARTIQVTYKYIDGAHFFVSYDKEAAGLCVANRDLRVAFDLVGQQLHVLYKLEYGEDAHFSPAIEFDIFAERVNAWIKDLGEPIDDLTPAAISRWTRDRRVAA